MIHIKKQQLGEPRGSELDRLRLDRGLSEQTQRVKKIAIIAIQRFRGLVL